MRRLPSIMCLCLVFFTTLTAQNAEIPVELEMYLEQVQASEQEMNAPEACSAYAKAVVFCRENATERHRLPALLLQYGSVLSYAGEYEKTVDALNEALRLIQAQNEPDKLLEARVFMQFGVLHFFQEKWDDALYYYEKAHKSASQLNNLQGLSIAENNIANIHQKKGNYKKAIAGYEQSLALQEQLRDTATICNTYFNIGTCYEELDLSEKALLFFEQSLHLATSINDVEIKSLSLMHLASLALMRDEFREAESLLDRAEEMVKNSGYRQVLTELYNLKTRFYEQQGNYRAAYETYKLNRNLADSITNEKLLFQTNELKIQLQTEEKEQQIIMQQLELKNKNRFLTLLTIFSVIGIALTGVLFLFWKQRRAQSKKLLKLNATKDRLFSIISHDLKSPATAQKMAIAHLSEHMKRIEDENIQSILKTLQANATEQVTVIDNLMDWARVQTEKITYSPQNMDIVPVVSDEIRLQSVATQNKSLHVSTDLPASCIVFADKQMISIVLRNLLNNAVKFTESGNSIFVSCKCTSEEALITVSDTGIGMSRMQIQAFRSSASGVEIRFGTKGEKGTGLGLGLCKDLLERNHSRLLIESEEKKGTTISFTLKKAINNNL